MSQLGTVAGFPSFHAIGNVLPAPHDSQCIVLSRGQFGAVANGRTSSAINNIALVVTGRYLGCLWLRQQGMVADPQTMDANREVLRIIGSLSERNRR
jgi:hypothetical protein